MDCRNFLTCHRVVQVEFYGIKSHCFKVSTPKESQNPTDLGQGGPPNSYKILNLASSKWETMAILHLDHFVTLLKSPDLF